LEKKSIVITGSTRGIGLGLAGEFLKRGCQVTINGRSQSSVGRALEELGEEYSREDIAGLPGDVSNPQTHHALWDAAAAAFGRVDIWINNAGLGHPMLMIWELPVEDVNQVLDVNIKGLIYGSQTAVSRMLDQGYGHLYNMEGFGSTGRMRPGISIYGTSKAAVSYFSKALTEETRQTPVKVSTLSPGMVITDLITDRYEGDPQGLEQAKKIFNTIADRVETVTPWLAEKVLRNDKTGAKIRWLTPMKLLYRFVMAPFRKRDLFT
jgi:NAD(P)-dependent dehydrogenase (short-subunit alcohol dehydrogenase family)